jgi:predicted ATP-binding protein involved in virulence/polyhydroxyalkanoate synthesis regulator phasin
MELIGIRIDQNYTKDAIKKNLKQEWFPFLNYYILEENELIDANSGQNISDEQLLGKLKVKREQQKEDFIYSTKGSPKITIHAIVGKNGSGKSTILEILFRIINNFAFSTIGGERSNDLLEAKGVSASLFYSIPTTNEKETVYCLTYKQSTNNSKTNLKLIGDDAISLECNKVKPLLVNHIAYLEKFFYTVVVNYSHYSFNTIDVDGLKDGVFENMYDDSGRPLFYQNGNPAKEIQYHHWLNGLFHKNDGYLTPIVLNPMRTKGNFDVNREQGLSRQRLTGILILKPDFLIEYKAINLQFDFKWRNIQSKLEKQALAYKSDQYISLLLDIYARWAKKINVQCTLLKYNKTFHGGGFKSQPLNDLPTLFKCIDEHMTSLDQQLHTTLLYLAYKSISISTKYLSFQNKLETEEEKQKIIEDTDSGSSHISLKIRQAKNHIKNRLLDSTGRLIPEKPRRNDDFISIPIDGFVKKNQLEGKTIDEIFDKLYPANYNTDILLKKGNETPVTLRSMSSGERQMLYSLSSVLYHLVNLQSVEADNIHRFRYNHINILLDEVEMYYHPEYQRQFVYKLISLIEGLKLDKNKIQSINICIITHSPFLLSDIPKNNILFLHEGSVANKQVKGETFGANVFDILKNGFFLDVSVGDFFLRKMQSIIDEVDCHKKNSSSLSNDRYNELSAIVKLIGEPLLQDKIQSMLDDVFFDKNNIDELDDKIRKLENKLGELKDKKENMQ